MLLVAYLEYLVHVYTCYCMLPFSSLTLLLWWQEGYPSSWNLQ